MYPRDNTTLFANVSLYAVLEAHIKQAQQKVDEIPREKFLASADELIYEHVWDDLRWIRVFRVEKGSK